MSTEFYISLNDEQEVEFRAILGLANNETLDSAAIKRALKLSPDKKAGRPKGAKNKSKIGIAIS